MSLLNPLFDPAREAALVTGAGMALAALSPMRWSAKDCEPYSPMCAKIWSLLPQRLHLGQNWPWLGSAIWQAAALATNCWLPHTQPSGESRTSYTARPLNGTKPTTRSQ
jgi:hypothetical protein